MFYTYILLSEKTKKYYIGSCENISNRLARHNAGATKSGQPWKVVYTETFETNSDALAREKYSKSTKSKIYILNLIARFVSESRS
jgi:putative endonuclease